MKTKKIKGTLAVQHPTTVWRFRAEEPPFSQIAKVICGRAIVSIHMRPVSTPSLRSVGHSSHVHGTQAQIYLATSPYLNVGCNVAAKTIRPHAKPLKQENKSKLAIFSRFKYFKTDLRLAQYICIFMHIKEHYSYV